VHVPCFDSKNNARFVSMINMSRPMIRIFLSSFSVGPFPFALPTGGVVERNTKLFIAIYMLSWVYSECMFIAVMRVKYH